jgi:hypothetical protein
MTRYLSSALAALIAAVLLVPAAASARGPANHVITLGASAGGISLLDKRSTVLSKLGKPYYENANGYMQYEPDVTSTLFDVYREGGAKSSRVRLIGIADPRFKLADGTKIFARGGLKKLKAKVGSRLHIVTEEDGEQTYVLNGTFRGHKTFTSFGTPQATAHSRVLQIFIGLA